MYVLRVLAMTASCEWVDVEWMMKLVTQAMEESVCRTYREIIKIRLSLFHGYVRQTKLTLW